MKIVEPPLGGILRPSALRVEIHFQILATLFIVYQNIFGFLDQNELRLSIGGYTHRIAQMKIGVRNRPAPDFNGMKLVALTGTN